MSNYRKQATTLFKRLSSLLILCLAIPTAAASNGQLSLISMGIGDADNITVKALRTLEAADIVFGMQVVMDKYPDLLADKELHEAGHGLFTSMKQPMSASELKAFEDKNRQIIREAIANGKNVAIIDYGDPLVYGPQSGYLDEFRDLSPQVIPGISSFNAANAALATSITSGKSSHSVILTAAMNADENYQGSDSPATLAASKSSLVFFTMKMNLPEVVAQLKTHYPDETPIAIVNHAGSAEQQQVIKTTLGTLLKDTDEGEKLPFEHLIYVGDFLQ
ncbi:SAM-dependent methyltransferase [Oligella urethralis]|uniref:Uroporphyrin-III methyltransferase n=1 Tax=Oligella urethralis DNF00040 TaxID=1401065 RepID=A0A095YTH8_9BURK|nr:SAM-dependent methyltransferase [Oligella urethralis]KGF25456.1 uroporphyrin-III methyltransferase [Oligella urethralis DNF00040]